MFVHDYEPGDDIKLYVATVWNEHLGTRVIHAFSDDKDMMRAYLNTRNRDLFEVHVIKGELEDVNKIVNMNLHAEIDFHVLETQDPNEKGKMMQIPVPMTEDEKSIFNESRKYMSFNADETLYEELYNMVAYLDDDYRDALSILHLDEMCRFMLAKPGSLKYLQEAQFDELRFFCKVHEELF